MNEKMDVATKRERHTVVHETPSIGTRLDGKMKGKVFTATVVDNGNGKPCILMGDVKYKSMSAAAIAAAGGSINGWRFWHASQVEVTPTDVASNETVKESPEIVAKVEDCDNGTNCGEGIVMTPAMQTIKKQCQARDAKGHFIKKS